MTKQGAMLCVYVIEIAHMALLVGDTRRTSVAMMNTMRPDGISHAVFFGWCSWSIVNPSSVTMHRVLVIAGHHVGPFQSVYARACSFVFQ